MPDSLPLNRGPLILMPMQSKLSFALRFLGYVVILLVGILGGTILLNLNDEELCPEVVKILGKPQSPTEKQLQAHYFFYGMKAGEIKDPEAKGRELWKNFESVPKGQRRDFFSDNFEKISNFSEGIEYKGCENGRKICTRAALKLEPKPLESVNLHRERLELYLRLLEVGEAPVVYFGDPEIVFPPLRLDPKLSKMLYPLWAQWLSKDGHHRVFNSMEMTNGFYFSLMSEGNLLERLIAQMLMEGNLKFLIQESEEDPKFKTRIPRELFESFRMPSLDTMINGAVERELVTFVNVLETMKLRQAGHPTDLNTLSPPQLGLFQIYKPALFFRKNETINKYFDLQMQSITTDCRGESQEDLYHCVPAFKWSSEPGVWGFFDNPLGRVITQVMATNTFSQRQKLESRLREFHQLKSSFVP